MLQHALIDIQGGKHLIVPLEDLDGVPALLLLRHVMYGSLLNVRQRMLYAAGEGVLRDGLAVLGGIDGSFCGSHNAGSLQGGDLYDRAAKLTGKLLYIDLVAVLLYQIHHVDGNNDRNPQFC